MAESTMVTKYMPAYEGNYTRGRARYDTIKEITIHHCAAILSIEELGRVWQRVGRRGSSHYGVSGTAVGQYVREEDIAWTNGNWAANCRAVTIEVSNSDKAPNWPVSEASFETLIKLVADIAMRNNLGTLVLGENLTWHQMYDATACPGPYLLSRMQDIADRANQIISASQVLPLSPDPVEMVIGPASSGDVATLRQLAESLCLGFTENEDGTMLIGPASSGDQLTVLRCAAQLQLPYSSKLTTQPAAPDMPDQLWYVQAGAFAKKNNADAYAAKLKAAGFDAIVKEG